MSANDEALEDLLGTLRWALEIEWTDEQRAAIKPLCVKIAGSEPTIPSWRLSDEPAKKRAAISRAEKAEARVAELEGVLRNKRQEFVFRRGVDKRISR
jgi:hypothetical protein